MYLWNISGIAVSFYISYRNKPVVKVQRSNRILKTQFSTCWPGSSCNRSYKRQTQEKNARDKQLSRSSFSPPLCLLCAVSRTRSKGFQVTSARQPPRVAISLCFFLNIITRAALFSTSCFVPPDRSFPSALWKSLYAGGNFLRGLIFDRAYSVSTPQLRALELKPYADETLPKNYREKSFEEKK